MINKLLSLPQTRLAIKEGVSSLKILSLNALSARNIKFLKAHKAFNLKAGSIDFDNWTSCFTPPLWVSMDLRLVKSTTMLPRALRAATWKERGIYLRLKFERQQVIAEFSRVLFFTLKPDTKNCNYLCALNLSKMIIVESNHFNQEHLKSHASTFICNYKISEASKFEIRSPKHWHKCQGHQIPPECLADIKWLSFSSSYFISNLTTVHKQLQVNYYPVTQLTKGEKSTSITKTR